MITEYLILTTVPYRVGLPTPILLSTGKSKEEELEDASIDDFHVNCTRPCREAAAAQLRRV